MLLFFNLLLIIISYQTYNPDFLNKLKKHAEIPVSLGETVAVKMNGGKVE